MVLLLPLLAVTLLGDYKVSRNGVQSCNYNCQPRYEKRMHYRNAVRYNFIHRQNDQTDTKGR